MLLDIDVVGHRGVRNIETENTLKSLQRALKAGVDAVELDIHATKDGELVTLHNRSLRHVYGVNKRIDELDYNDVKKIRTLSGDTIPTLQDVLSLRLPVPLMLDIKKTASAEAVCKLMAQNHAQKWFVSTFYWDKLPQITRRSPHTPVSVATSFRPHLAVKRAATVRAKAVTAPVYLLPLVYRRARKAGLKVIVYMNYLSFLLTTPWIVRSLRKLYPEIIVCTDRPDRIVPALDS